MSINASFQPDSNSPSGAESPRLVAVLDIGASAIRMAIAEIVEGGAVRTLENLTQAVSLGRDTFSKGVIDAETTDDCVRVLQSYREKLKEFGIVRRDQIHVVATSAVREASNRLVFLKRLYVATGFRVEPFDEAAVNRVTFLGVRPLFQARPDLSDGSTLFVEVGGGSTQVLLFSWRRRHACPDLPPGRFASAEDDRDVSRANGQGAEDHGKSGPAMRHPDPAADLSRDRSRP
jgi:exopolyphosphatase/pppGpp-phosphohydrolase